MNGSAEQSVTHDASQGGITSRGHMSTWGPATLAYQHVQLAVQRLC